MLLRGWSEGSMDTFEEVGASTTLHCLPAPSPQMVQILLGRAMREI